LGNDLAIPHDPNPLGDDVLTAVGGHLDVHSSPITLEVGWHFRACIAVLDVADLGLAGMYCSSELVDTASCLGKALVSEGSTALHHRDEAVHNSACGIGQVIVLQAEDGLS